MKFYQSLTRRIRMSVHRIRPRRLPRIFTFRFYWTIACFPFTWLRQSWKKQRTRDLLLGLPAVMIFAGILYLHIQTRTQKQALTAGYFTAAQVAISAKDFTTAEFLLRRVLDQGDTRVSDARYSMAVVLDETGRTKRASKLFQMLAPDDSLGNRKAHRRLALILSNQLSPDSSPEYLRKTQWHLKASGKDSSPEFAIAWGRYYLTIGDAESAKPYLRMAVEKFPELWQVLAKVELTTGDVETSVISFQKASNHLRKQLVQTPHDVSVRSNYANILMKLGQFEDSRLVLEEGIKANPEGPWKRLLASVMVNFHDVRASKGASISELLGYLGEALTYDSEFSPALERLISYATADVKGNVELKTILAQVLAGGNQHAMAHLAMGNLCWIEGDHEQAMIHFEIGIELREDVPVLLNNLAWMVAHDSQSPDLPRAMGLIETALSHSPKDARFLDTRGTIHMLQGSWKLAMTDFEKSVSGVSNKQAVHLKLAKVYDHLNMHDIAEQHRVLSQPPATADSEQD